MTGPTQADPSIGDDMDLENAIGDVFDGFDFNAVDPTKEQDKDKDNDNNKQQQQEEEPLPTETSESNLRTILPSIDQKEGVLEEQQDEEEELNLDDAIGDALNDVLGGGDTKEDQSEKTEQEDNLEDAIGEAFNGMFEETNEDNETDKQVMVDPNIVATQEEKSRRQDNEVEPEEPKSDKSNNQPDDEDLDDLIGQAFDNITTTGLKETNKEPEQSQDQETRTELPTKTAELSNFPINESKERNILSDSNDGTAVEDSATHETSKDEKHSLASKREESSVIPDKAIDEHTEEVLPKSDNELEELDDVIGQAFENVIIGGQQSTESSQEPNESAELDRAKSSANNDNEPQPMDLDEAIGDAFKDIMSTRRDNKTTEVDVELNEQVSNTNSKDDKQGDVQVQPVEDDQEDEINLDEAIGDAFNNILGEKEKDTESKFEESSMVPEKEVLTSANENVTDTIDLDAAIGDAFKDVLGVDNNESKPRQESTVEVPTPIPNKPDQPDVDADTDAMDLDKAIGAAFENLQENHSSPSSTLTSQQKGKNKETIDEEIDLDAAIGDAFRNVLPQQSRDQSLPLPPDEADNALEDAIGEAFKSLVTSRKKDDQLNDDDLNAMITQSFQQVLHSPRKNQQTRSDDMESAITQAFKSAMAAKSVPQLTTREIAIRNLAVEISHQVQDHLKDDKFNPPLPFIPGLPQLDEGVLAHFQKEAYTDHNKETNKNENLQSALSNAMKTADNEAGGVADLEQLEMNDILQNAFRMALEHPQELLSDLEIEQTIQVPQLTRPVPPRRPRFAPPKPSTSSTFKSYQRATPVVTQPPAVATPPKSTPAVPKRPVSKPAAPIPRPSEVPRKPSLLSNPAVTSQLTTVISTLTSRINSGELSDANILQVIRQLTEELASGGSLTPFLKKGAAIEDVVVTYRDDARQQMLKTLQMSKIFLEKKLLNGGNDENKKSVELVNTIINAFDPVGYAKSVVNEIKDDELNSIFAYFNEVASVFLEKCPTSRFSPATVKNIKAIQEKITKKDIAKNHDDVEKISKDEKLIKPLTDLFNLLAGSSLLDNSQSMLIATAVTLSVTGFVYQESTKFDNDAVITATCKILNGVLLKTPGMTIKDGVASASSTSKRISDLILAGDMRRTKIDPEQIKIAVNGSNREQQTESWNSQSIATAASSIRIPQYRRPSGIDKSNIPHKPALTLPKHSPFISNKFSANSSPLQVSHGNSSNRLKRPGSFQRPTNAKAKTTSLGFPKLYSTSLKYN